MGEWPDLLQVNCFHSAEMAVERMSGAMTRHSGNAFYPARAELSQRSRKTGEKQKQLEGVCHGGTLLSG